MDTYVIGADKGLTKAYTAAEVDAKISEVNSSTDSKISTVNSKVSTLQSN